MSETATEKNVRPELRRIFILVFGSLLVLIGSSFTSFFELVIYTIIGFYLVTILLALLNEELVDRILGMNLSTLYCKVCEAPNKTPFINCWNCGADLQIQAHSNHLKMDTET